MPNLSPWQAWVHLYCLKDRAGLDADPPAPCAVTFECNGFSGEPVTWPVEVAPKTIFSYWPYKMVDGMSANLQAALMAAGKPVEEARRRTTCEVFSPDPLTVRGYTLFGDPTLVPVAEPARPDVSGEPGERRRQATLPNLSPWQAWVHLYCLKDQGPDADPPAPCAVTFECNGQSGEPVTWPVEVAPKTIFSYWPNKTVNGTSANLQAALIAAGKPVEEARRRTTCEVFSPDPLTVRGYTLFGDPTLVPVAEPARPDVSGEPGERRRQATLPNLSPWQAWVHLYCLKDQGPDADPPAPCAVTFECNGQSGEPVTWPVEVAPKTIFTYWPNKTATDGTAADLQAALIAAGKTVEEARRRTTCEVSSADPIAVRGYTRFNGQPTVIPVTAY